MYVTQGSTVGPQAPVALFVSKQLEVLVNVEEERLSQLAKNQNASLQVSAYPGQTFPAVVTSIAPVADQTSHTFVVKVTPVDKERVLRSGMYANVSILTQEKQNAILAPRAAVTQVNNQPTVYVVKDNQVEQRPVTTGLANDQQTEILSGPQDPGELFDLAENTLKPRLEAVSGVASVNVSGGREREIQVYTDPAKLAAFQLTLASVQQSLAANNLTLPVGSLEPGRQKTSVRSVGEFTGLDEISNVILSGEPKPSNPGDKPKPAPAPGQDQGGLVYLHDVASVQEGFKDQTQRLRYNGQDTVNISIVKTTDANTIAVDRFS